MIGTSGLANINPQHWIITLQPMDHHPQMLRSATLHNLHIIYKHIHGWHIDTIFWFVTFCPLNPSFCSLKKEIFLLQVLPTLGERRENEANPKWTRRGARLSIKVLSTLGDQGGQPRVCLLPLHEHEYSATSHSKSGRSDIIYTLFFRTIRYNIYTFFHSKIWLSRQNIYLRS